MDNLEEVLDALTDFQKKPPKEFPPLLNEYLCHVAKTGETLFPWARLKPFFRAKLDDVMIQYNADLPSDHLANSPNVENAKFEDLRDRILVAFEKFHGAPFTVQRLCELIVEPKRHYKRTDKFLRGIEKNVLVVSTVDPFGRKIVSESPKNLVNGLDANGEEVVQTEETVAMPQPMVNWSTDDIGSSWPTQSTSSNNNTHFDPTHNGQGDSSDHKNNDSTPSQSTDTSLTSHPHGDILPSSETLSGEATPTTSADPTNTQTVESQSIVSESQQIENSAVIAADHNIQAETESIHLPTSLEKSVEISGSDLAVSEISGNEISASQIPVEIATSDIPVEITTSELPVVESVIDTSSNNSISENNGVELSLVTLTAETNEESVSTTANCSSISKTADEETSTEDKNSTEGDVTSSESAEQKQAVESSSDESKTVENSVSQSDNPSDSDNRPVENMTSSDNVTDNVTSSESDKISDSVTMDSDSDTNEAISRQNVINEEVSKSPSESTAAVSNVITTDQSESVVSRSEEPMDQD